jgi:polygalacturonase
VKEAVPIQRSGLVEFVRCQRMNLTGSQILDGTPYGVFLEDCADVLINGCTITDKRPNSLMKAAVMWQGGGENNIISNCRLGKGTDDSGQLPEHVNKVNCF